MKNFRIFLFIMLVISGYTGTSGQEYERTEDLKGISEINSDSGIKSVATIEVVYDNFVSKQGTKADWGFSILLGGLEKVILFDTGTKPEIFKNNVHFLGIDPAKIDMLVLSHEHMDHTGGIPALIEMKTGIPVVFPVSFSENFSKRMVEIGLKPILVSGPSMICCDLFTSGEFEFEIPEQALVLDTKKGLVVITGCAHPGIIMMLDKINKDFGKNIYMVCGGFHLMNKSDEEMKSLITDMKKLGIVKCGATHCTGRKQISMFREAFGENYVEMGTGNKILIN